MEIIDQTGDGGRAEEREMQGLDGAFAFPERLLQQIWRRGEMDLTGARTTTGETVQVLHPGRWNRLGGPDFKDARLRLGDQPVTGDVELHLHAADWDAHGHATDPAYARVVLHAVLFPPGPAGRGGARRPDGTILPVLVLLPLLRRGLEEFAEEEVVENLARCSPVPGLEALVALTPEERTLRLQSLARARWNVKVRYAGARIARLGWRAACHHAALEILGYSRNRAPMLRVAGQFPLESWTMRGFRLDVVLASEEERWALQGVRPANRPAERLKQYAAWAARWPDWPVRLEALGDRLAAASRVGEGPTAKELARWRQEFAGQTGAEAVGVVRLDNLVADGFLPLLAARMGGGFFPWWSAWPAGDVPESLGELRRLLAGEGGKPPPRTQGFVQGVLGWLIESEAKARR